MHTIINFEEQLDEKKKSCGHFNGVNQTISCKYFAQIKIHI